MKNKSFCLYFLFALFISIILSVRCDLPTDQGKVLYNAYCANCHMENGEGLRGLIPPLAKADYLSIYQDDLACIIRNGMKGPITVNGKNYDQEMIGFKDLNEIEISNIVNYINRAWGNNETAKNINQIKANLESCQ